MIADPCAAICADRCAEFGDPPCYDLHREKVIAFEEDGDPDPGRWIPCDDCKRDAGVEVVDEIDPAAAIRPLI